MNPHRRIGFVLITVSVLLSVAALLLSTGWTAGVDLLPTISVFLKLQIFDDSEGIPTKYALLACLALFSAGLLFLIGVFSTTSSKAQKDHSK